MRATNLADGSRKQIGKADFGTTVSMFAAGDNLWTIETDGNLFRVDPANGVWVRVGPEAAWKALRAGAVLKDQLYTAESDGTLHAAKLADGKRQRIGPAEFGNTQWMFAASNAIYTIETDGNLFVVTVRPPESIDAFDCFPKEFEKVFREQGRDYYRNFDRQLILGKQATLPAIRDGLVWLRKKATRKDRVVMYLTCHGGMNAEEGWGVETADGQTLWYTFPVMLCHLGAFLRRPLMSVSNLTRTVWKYRRLFRTDPFKSAIVSNSRLCVALHLSFFQNRSITFNCGL